MTDTFDVVIVGAGISGISAAYRIRKRNPGISHVILERRANIGGTWDLFRYPASAPTAASSRSASRGSRGPGPKGSPTATTSAST